MRKAHVKRRPPALRRRSRLFPVKPVAPRSVGQLAPKPDATRQCAFDLRFRVQIFSCGPDEPAALVPSTTLIGLLWFRIGGCVPAVPAWRSSFPCSTRSMGRSAHDAEQNPQIALGNLSSGGAGLGLEQRRLSLTDPDAHGRDAVAPAAAT